MTPRHLLFMLIAAAAIVRVATIGDQDLWFDEYFTREAVLLPLSQIPVWILQYESTPPLYYLLTAAWERVFGDGDLALRTVSLLAGIATVPVVYAAGRALGAPRAGLFAAALTACSPLMIWYSQEARSYALLALLAAVSFWLFAETLARRDTRWLLAWAGAAGAAICIHHLAGLLIALEAVWLAVAWRDRRPDVALATVAICVVGVAMAPYAIAQEDTTSWLAFLPVGDRAWALPQHFLVGLSSPSPLVGPVAIAAVLIAGVFARDRLADARTAFVVGAVITAAGAALVLLSALVWQDYLNTRNLITLWAPFALAIGALACVRPAGPPLAALLCLAGIALATWTAATPSAGRPGWDGVVDALGEPQAERVVITPQLASSLAAYLGTKRNVAPGEVVATDEVAVVRLREVDDHTIGPCWWLGFCGGRALLGSSEPALEVPEGFRLAERGTTSLFEWERWVAARPIALPAPEGTDGVYLQAPG